MKEKENSNQIIEEGSFTLIKLDEVFSLIENKDDTKNKIFVNLNYRGKPSEDEFVSLYTDFECKNLFKELKSSRGFNNTFNFDIPVPNKLYLKANVTKEFYFYYKYCTEKDLEQMNNINTDLKVQCLENKDNKLKISFASPYSQDVKFNIKYSIYLSEGKKYGIFRDEKTKEARIIEGNQNKYETEVKIESSKKGQFVYVVAEPKDPSVNLRPRFIYKGAMVPDADNKSETIINAILIVLIIITLIYKIMKKRRLAKQKAEANSANSTLI